MKDLKLSTEPSEKLSHLKCTHAEKVHKKFGANICCELTNTRIRGSAKKLGALSYLFLEHRLESGKDEDVSDLMAFEGN